MKPVKKRKCSCGHYAKDHYKSDVAISQGKIFCNKIGCTRWNRCDIKEYKNILK